jgi:hypothetical protein
LAEGETLKGGGHGLDFEVGFKEEKRKLLRREHFQAFTERVWHTECIPEENLY